MTALIGEEPVKGESKRCAIYARVSTAKQAEAGNIQRQKERLITYAVEKGYQVKAVHAEIASGLNENRRELAKLAKTASKNEIDVIIIEYKDRLARFGYKYKKLSNWKQWSSIKKAVMAAIKKSTKQEVQSLVSWQHYRKQLLAG